MAQRKAVEVVFWFSSSKSSGDSYRGYIIKEWILPGTTIAYDGWAAYSTLSQYGYTLKVVNHSKQWVNEEGYHTNHIVIL